MRRIFGIVVALVFVACTAAFAGPGQNPLVKAAVHVQGLPTTCAEVPTFHSCSDINAAWYSYGDVVVIPVLFDLVNVTSAEFGLTWPTEWGTMNWTRCAGDAGVGSITNPGDWTGVSWSACHVAWSVALGYGLVTVAPPAGYFFPIFHFQGTHMGVYDCSPSWVGGPFYNATMSIYGAGIGMVGDDPCAPDAVEPTTWGMIKALVQ